MRQKSHATTDYHPKSCSERTLSLIAKSLSSAGQSLFDKENRFDSLLFKTLSNLV